MEENPSKKYKLLVLTPKLQTMSGHFFSYCTTLQKAAKINDWEYAAAIPKNCQLNDLPFSWHKILSIDTFDSVPGPRIIKRLYNKFCYQKSLYKFLSEHIASNQKTLIFTEYFSRHQLRALIYCLILLPTKNVSVCLLYRDHHTIYRKPSDALFFKKCHHIIAFLLRNNNFHLLTDCELLQQPLEIFFEKDFSLFPIIEPCSMVNKTPSQPINKIVCWWAGRPGKEKGLNIIKETIDQCENDQIPIHFITSKSSGIDASLHFNFIDLSLLPEVLSSDEYLKQLFYSDIILTPYCQKHYKWKTSGIFIEAIAAKKPILVTEGTWMAHELKKFDLQELITTWEPNDVIKKIAFIQSNQDTKKKIQVMQQAFLEKYSVNSFAAVLQSLVTDVTR
ncbi:MAG: glycosyltransferase [Waddliaceae bacterium]|jgi:hypothetical protein|nr:glycosyltransferase [Waddliaceae bacterium]MBT3578977.1 glycosyltransferase [Waddliaceae bacterium]MBT4444673.1 glycosyltransferase [Waddliaceae bacterium]MBT6929174.1 glycosyltransferase [Waddliaceae bacterium]MBT7265148.1 glycosyltransferase [Waddliaceae bacterium]